MKYNITNFVFFNKKKYTINLQHNLKELKITFAKSILATTQKKFKMDMNKSPAIEPHFAPIKPAPDVLFVSASVSFSESEDGAKAEVTFLLLVAVEE
jgi:hypothetical protein